MPMGSVSQRKEMSFEVDSRLDEVVMETLDGTIGNDWPKAWKVWSMLRQALISELALPGLSSKATQPKIVSITETPLVGCSIRFLYNLGRKVS